MEQLTGIDSYMLYSERGNNYNHVAALGIYDPSTAPGGKVRFKDILKHFSCRLDTHKLFRRRLMTVPGGVDRPYWVENADLDIEFHIRHLALPQPGDWRQLMIQVARLHSRPMDRTRPLWEVYVIEGLDRIPGLPRSSFALFIKFHHASVDGMAAAAVLKAVHSLTASDDARARKDATSHADRDPTAVELYSRAIAHGAARTAGLSSLYVKTLGKLAKLTLGEMVRQVNPDASGRSLPAIVKAPVTRFNHPVSANRVVEAVAVPIEAMKKARAKLEGVTINDFFLTIVGGALHKYLHSKGELPAKSLMALMPISLREDGKAGKGGNQVGGVPVAVHSEIADPLERLVACQRDAQEAKRGADALGREFLNSVINELPNAAADVFMKRFVFPQLNTTVSNVRGPDAVLYAAGARLVHFYPVSIATDYVGLNHTGFSYNGVMWICVVACRNMMPDPGFYADCLRESASELFAAIGAMRGAKRPAKVKRSAKATSRKPSTTKQQRAAASAS